LYLARNSFTNVINSVNSSCMCLIQCLLNLNWIRVSSAKFTYSSLTLGNLLAILSLNSAIISLFFLPINSYSLGL
jgi:hypothetical protein